MRKDRRAYSIPPRLLLLRWPLVLATAYLVWFSQPGARVPWFVTAYILVYVLSTPFFHWLLRQLGLKARMLTALVIFDVSMVSLGLVLSHREQVDFSPVVFLALFVSAIALNLRAAVATAVLLGSVHLAAVTFATSTPVWTQTQELLRLPFLVAVAAFFGYLCDHQRRRARREILAQRQRDRLAALAAAAHDIRSPLANVVTLTELVLEGDAGPLNPEQRDLLERAHAELWRVVRRTTNLMDAARLDRYGFSLDLELTDFAVLAESTLDAMRTAAHIRRLKLVFENTAQRTLVRVDRAQLERVLANLIDNALKYSPANGTVWLRMYNAREGWLEIEVADQGPGIPADLRDTLFRPYARRHSGPPLSGSGLGLYIVRKIVDAHKGTVSLDSALHGGTRVRISLPLAAEGGTVLH